MAPLPRHGTIRRYRTGCRCDPCKAKNTATKAKEREAARKRAGTVPTTRKRVPTAPTVPTDGPTDVPTEDDDGVKRGPIETAARRAFIADDADLVAVLRYEVIFASARIMDDPAKPHLFVAQSNVMRQTVADILQKSPAKDGETDALTAFLEAAGGSRRGRGAPPVDDTAQPGP